MSPDQGSRYRPRIARIPWLPWLLLIPYASVLYLLRTRHYLLGDQMVWIECLREHAYHLYSEPLAASTWHLFAAGL